MINRILLIITLISAIGNFVSAQDLTQTVRGKIIDEVTEFPLIGATIYVTGSDPVLGASADIDGEFEIKNVPIGRQTLNISFVGYEPVVIPDILIHSGKSVYLEIKMKEQAFAMDEIVIEAEKDKDVPINDLAGVSTRTFSVEETQRYAGGLDDPGRMVTAFAGVTPTTLGQNAIIIRGNAPKGVQWRMEGIEIPSPSHFAGATITGGGFVTLLSSHVLANSDFLTGAFPSEYGNALSGVFDMNLRSGNNQERENTFQAGLLGIDFASEGPISKNSKASYLFNYRYSTLGLIEPVLPEETNTIRYQDLSFKLNFPTKKAGEFSFWGVGGKDFGKKNEKLIMDQSLWEIEDDLQDYEYGFLVGASGIKHKINFGKNTMWKSSVVASVNDSYWDIDRLNESLELHPESRVDNVTGQFSFSSILNHKFSRRHKNRTGIMAHQHFYDIRIQEANDSGDPLTTIVDNNGSNSRWQFFSQSRFDLSNSITLNVGLHSQFFQLNKQFTLEPRANLQWHINDTKSVSIGYGNHSQMEDLKVYFIQNNSGEKVNEDLKMTRAHHLVLSYDWLIKDNLRLKIEPYYQYLYDAPVIADSSFSMLNFEQDWFLTADLVNEGKGRNYGVDLTLERFLDNNIYYLITGSVFKSEYRGGDGIWRDTRFNRGYAFNILGGKEWKLGATGNKWLGLNIRMNLMGGLRFSPVDVNSSISDKEVVYNENDAFSNQAPSINYVDFTISYRKNKKKHSSVWTLQVKNALGYEDFDGHRYNFMRNIVEEDNSTIVIPNLSYKIEF